MDWLSNVAVFVAAWGGVGAFADFLLGKTGQKRVRDTMEAWWVLLSDVRLGTFTAREAGVAAGLLERMFGTFWSWKRLRAVSLAVLASILVWGMGRVYHYLAGIGEAFDLPFRWTLMPVVVSIVSFWCATSVNIVLARLLARYNAGSPRRGLMLYAVLMTSQLAFITVSYELQMALIATINGSTYLPNGPYAGMRPAWLGAYLNNLEWMLANIWLDSVLGFFSTGLGGWGSIWSHIVTVLLYLAAMIRLGILILFTFSFLLRPAQRMLTLVIERLVESDRPILTLVFGGTAAIAKTLHAVF